MIDVGSLIGREYGPFEFELSAAKVAEYVDATGDERRRWTEYAPPSYAGAVLFQAAPAMFNDPDVAAFTKLLIHGDQQFAWVRPWPIGAHVSARGIVDRIRDRGGIMFTTFSMQVVDQEGAPYLSSRSTFLMSADQPPGAGEPELEEPPPEARGPNGVPTQVPVSDEAGELAPLEKSASRSDLVRYAAASQDFNPIHWDHRRAVDAGLGGVVAHGLLVAAWASQAAGRLVSGPHPLADARFRFRLPMPAATHARVSTKVDSQTEGPINVGVTVSSDLGEHVVATIHVNR